METRHELATASTVVSIRPASAILLIAQRIASVVFVLGAEPCRD
jgi:hypothetical protein